MIARKQLVNYQANFQPSICLPLWPHTRFLTHATFCNRYMTMARFRSATLPL